MNEIPNKGLLPAGVRDVLPPDAAFEAEVADGLMDCFAEHGYERVKPPLIEFEESLFGGAGAATANDTFRLMDPVSQRMMGVRQDMTVQVARIATTRLGNAPRPLRLCYAGEVLRIRGTQLRPERQFTQAGVELIGAESAAADVEVVLLAAAALDGIGVSGLTVDINMPTLVPAVCAGLGLDGETSAKLRAALDRKDAAALSAVKGEAARVLGGILDSAGSARNAVAALERIDLPEEAAAERDRLLETAALILEASPDLKLTVDPVENRGFEYHNGVTFSLFSRGVRGELGRGGRYSADAGKRTGENGGEPATGFTLFMDTVLRGLPEPKPARRLFLPFGESGAEAAGLRAEGWVVVRGLEPVEDARGEARRLGCAHVLVNGDIVSVD